MSNLDVKDLPEGWSVQPLGEAIKPTRPRIKPQEKPDLPFIGMEHIEAHTMKLLGTVPAGTMKSSAVHFQSGDVLYGRLRPYLNKVYKPDFEGLCSAEFIVFPNSEDVDSKYLQYFLNSWEFVSFASHLNEGDRPRVDFKQLSPYPFPLPSPEQQTRIVAEIEKQFSRLDEAVANLKRVKANFRRYKAAVLKAAVEGKLTEGTWKPIASAIESIEQGWSPQCERESSESNDRWAVIKTTAVQPMSFQQEEHKLLPDSLEPRSALEITQGDLLITRAGPKSRVGVSCLVRKTRSKLILCDKVYRLRCQKAVVTPEYLELVLNVPQILHAIDEIKTGISDSGVNLTQGRFMVLDIPLPPINIQRRIVDETERKTSVLSGMESEIDANLRRANRLRQSILKQAFSGQLVPQDSNDEPASVLLERIRNGVRAIHELPLRTRRKQDRAIHESPLRKPHQPTEPKPMPLAAESTTVYGDYPARILAAMQPGCAYARADLADPLGLSTDQWNTAIQELKRVGKVRQTGEKRGARYLLSGRALP